MKIQDLLLLEGPYDLYNHKVVFMAGSPGSGKTTIRKKIFGPNIKVVDVDALSALIAKQTQESQDFHPHAPIADKFRQSWLKLGLGMIIDGTGRNFQDYHQKREEFLKSGYDTAMILVRTPLEIAKQNEALRQQQTGRKVDPEFLERAWQQLENNRLRYHNLFGEHYWEINNVEPQVRSQLAQTRNEVNSWLTTDLVI